MGCHMMFEYTHNHVQIRVGTFVSSNIFGFLISPSVQSTIGTHRQHCTVEPQNFLSCLTSLLSKTIIFLSV